ncbi:MAG: SipW-dependent-type signal peptide-containing protein [Clostridia bacterium]|nr:SipW-dependent-type signal peptide-containing protein [Clostridia bacterium]
MKKKLVIAVSLLVIVAVAIAGTLAYFSLSTDEVENVFTVGKNVKVTLVDIFDPDSPVYPGANIKKEVGIKNTAAAGGSSVYAAITAEFKYFAPETYADGKLKYSNIISAAEYAALDAAAQADYVGITEDSEYIGYYIKATAVGKKYYAIDDSTTPPTETEVTDAAAIAAGEYNKVEATYDAGEPAYDATGALADYADYGDVSVPLWKLIKLQHGTTGAFVDGLADGWTYAGNTADGKAVFIYANVLNPGDYSAAFTNVHVNDVEPVFPFTITVKGYAVQSTGFDSAAEAIDDAFSLVAP